MAFIFEPEDLQAIAQKAIGLPRDEMFDQIQRELAVRYPGRICEQREWILNTAGGARGTLTIIYASMREYLIFFGTPIGNRGHTGRYHFADDWFWILEGDFWRLREGSPDREVYGAGDVVLHPRGTAAIYRIVDNARALEYARGWIPTMLPFGMADTVFNTLDYRGFFKTFWLYGKHVLRSFKGGKSTKDAGSKEAAR